MDLALAFEDSEPFQLTVEQYHSLMDQGIVEEGSKVELIEGMIVRMNAQASVHTVVIGELFFRIQAKLGEIGSVLRAYPTPTIAMPPHNALDPDIGVTVPPVPGPDFFPLENVRLLIEVANTSLRKNLGLKRDLYAAAGTPEYWVVDVVKAEVHRFASPTDGVYEAEPPVPLAGTLRSLTIDDLVIDGSGIL